MFLRLKIVRAKRRNKFIFLLQLCSAKLTRTRLVLSCCFPFTRCFPCLVPISRMEERGERRAGLHPFPLRALSGRCICNCSHRVGQNLVTWPYIPPRETGKWKFSYGLAWTQMNSFNITCGTVLFLVFSILGWWGESLGNTSLADLGRWEAESSSFYALYFPPLL